MATVLLAGGRRRSLGTQHRLPLNAVDPFRTERQWILLLIISVAWYVRGWDPFYNTGFMDETIAVIHGRMLLANLLEVPFQHPLSYSSGWYLWPVLAAIADKIGGIPAVRELGALMGVLGVVGVFGFAGRLFSNETGIAAAGFFALAAPSVYASRIATGDAGALAFFALGLWMFVWAWQEDHRRHWLLAAGTFFLALLCNYIVVIYFPFLILLALRQRRGVINFTLPLLAVCVAYGAYYRTDLLFNLESALASLGSRGLVAGAQQIYLWQRLDLWLMVALAVGALGIRGRRLAVASLLAGAGLMLAFHALVRPDFFFWKHAAYPMLFLAPAAAEMTLWVAHRYSPRELVPRAAVAAGTVLMVALAIGTLGRTWNMRWFIFWPNTDPIVAYMENKLDPGAQILVDDAALRYYFGGTLRQYQVTDSDYPYVDRSGPDPVQLSYHDAVASGRFDYVMLDGGISPQARAMKLAIDGPLRDRYESRMSMPDSMLGHTIEIYARRDPAPAIPDLGESQIKIDFPHDNMVLRQPRLRVSGWVTGYGPKWRVHAEVFTDRWYYQSEALIMPNGSYGADITLGGQGPQQCYHLVRARLFDEHGAVHASSTLFGVARANADGSQPACMPPPPPAVVTPPTTPAPETAPASGAAATPAAPATATPAASGAPR